MADLKYSAFAGSWDPSKASKFGWNLAKDLPSFGSFSLAEPTDPYASLLSQYGKPTFNPSTLSPEAQQYYAMAQGFQPTPTQAILQSQLRRIDAEQANRMSRENLKLAEEAAMREQERAEQRAMRQQGRDFTYNQAANLFSAIPRAFNPIPFDKTQEVIANIANITSPRNIKAIPQLQQAQFSMPTRQYFD